MLNNAINPPAAKLINRVLRDYPLACERLVPHAHARVDVHVGPISAALRITPQGTVAPVGEGASDVAKVTFHVPLAALPRLVKKDEAAYREIAFTGDSELAHALSTIARNVAWDIEEDLSELLGGGTTANIVSHRVVSGAKSIAQLRDEAEQRFTENMAEYLVHERHAFVMQDDLEALARDNETLRDDVSRLEARVNQLAARKNNQKQL